MAYDCPCGNGKLVRRITKKQGLNINRPFYLCPGSDVRNGVPNCDFYSFEDELRECECGRGLCRNKFVGKEKFWVRSVKGADACTFREEVRRTPAAPSTPPYIRTHAASSPSTHAASSSSPADSSNSRREAEILSRTLKATQNYNKILLEIIEDVAKLPLDDVRGSA